MIHHILENDLLPDVAPDSQLGRAYARLRDLALAVQRGQQERAGMRSEYQELASAARLALYTGKETIAREIAMQIESLNQRIEAADRTLSPLLADLRAAEDGFAPLYRQYAQSRIAIDSLRRLAG